MGKSVPRVDAVAKVTGAATYVNDIHIPGMLHGRILYSPYAHARINRIDLTRAKALPGVKAVIAGDGAPRNYISLLLSPRWQDKLLFAREKVRYAGEEVAAVAAISETIAEQALRLIDIEYEQVPAVTNIDEAIAPGAPLVHERLGTNVSSTFTKDIGDVEKAFAQSDVIVEGVYRTPAISHSCMEPHGIVAQFLGEDLHIWMSTQAPYYVQRDIEHVLGIPLVKIHIHETAVGGGFGAKSRIAESDLIAILLARQANRPVKIILSREEELVSTRTRHPHVIYLKTGAKKDGTIVAWEAKIKIDNGAYNDIGPLLGAIEGSRVGSLYPAPNIRIHCETIYTNLPFGGRFRAYGNSQITFAIESQMEILAQRLGMDSLSIRLENAVLPGEKTPWGWEISSCGLSECLQTVWSRVEEREEAQKWRGEKPVGKGLAAMTHRSGGSAGEFCAAFVEVSDGDIRLLTGVSEIGQGPATILSQMVAETLGVSMDHVMIKTMDTDVTPIDLGSRSNRVTFMAGRAVTAAAEDARSQILKLAEERLGKPSAELEMQGGEIFWVKDPSIKISLRSVTSSSDSKGAAAILGRGVYDRPVEKGECTYVYGANSVKVEVDTETGEVSLLSATAAHDLGKAINPMLSEGQIEGGMVQGIGWGLMEELIREKGVTINNNFLDYKIPTMADVPPIKTALVETNDPYGAFGCKGLGEPTVVPMAPALANAIFNATGIRITELPFSPERVLRAIEKFKDEKYRKP